MTNPAQQKRYWRNESKFIPIGRKSFDSMQDAFDYCRQVDRPVLVFVGTILWKLFPSGRAEEAYD